MKKYFGFAGLLVAFSVLFGVSPVRAHCEIPCGIFDDHLRIHKIEENIKTIHKAMNMVQSLHKEKDSPQTMNQITRWITLKEEVAIDTQEIVNRYFLAQRIKSSFGEKTYVDLLKKAHALIVYAMKCKQTVNDDIIGDFRKALKEFESAYNGATKQQKKK